MPGHSLPRGLPPLPRRLPPHLATIGPMNGFRTTGSCEKENCSVKKGLLWQQRDRLFSRWKERFFVLTRDYLICFHKASRGIASSEMGSFIFKVTLTEVDSVEREERKGGPVAVIFLEREGKLYLRCKNGIEDWLKALKETVQASKGRREALRHTLTRDFPTQMLDSLQNFRAKLPLQHTLSDSQQEAARVNRAVAQEMHGLHLRPVDQHLGTPRASRNRLSLMTDIDFDSSTIADTETPPSTPSYKMSNKATPTSTPHGSLYHSRSSSRMSSEHFGYFDDGSPLAPVQVRHKEPPREHYIPTNNTTASLYASTSHILNGHDKLNYASNNSTATRSSISSGSPRGLVNDKDVHHFTNGNHQRSISSHQHYYYQQNDNWNSQQNQHNLSPKHEHFSNGIVYSINPRRFSLASATEVTHNSKETSHWDNNNVQKTNRNISRVASDRHTSARPTTPDRLYREHSGTDLTRKEHSLRKRWGINQDIHATETVAAPRHPIGIFTHL